MLETLRRLLEGQGGLHSPLQVGFLQSLGLQLAEDRPVYIEQALHLTQCLI